MMMFDMIRSTGAMTIAVTVLAASILATPEQAHAQASNCQVDFQKVMAPREALMTRINGYRTKRPTPGQACSTLGQLVTADGNVLKWMTENKDWCQIPDTLVEQLQTASGQVSKSRGQACAAAKNQVTQQARARAAQARAQQGGGGAPPVGSGVRLPQGAL
jgi:hypothetical protein